jgi:PPOX class probable F420-dependent enzyme
VTLAKNEIAIASRGGTDVDPIAYELCAGPNFAHVASLMKDGSPHTAPVWIDVEGDDRVAFCKLPDSVAVRNLQRDPRVAISIRHANKPYRAAYLRGHVVGIRGEPESTERLHRLCLKYEGKRYPDPPSPLSLIVVQVERSRGDDFSHIREA